MVPDTGADKDAISDVLEVCVLAQSGQRFFDALVRTLGVVVDPLIVLVGVIDEADTGTIRTVALLRNGALSENLGYRIEGTPCSIVLSTERMCLYADGIADLFPRDETVEDERCGYCGVPLRDRDGTIFGIMALFTSTPITDPQRVAAEFRRYEKRAALELEQLVAARAAAADLKRARASVVADGPAAEILRAYASDVGD